MNWNSALSFPNQRMTTLLVIFVMQLTFKYSIVDGLRCYACNYCQNKDSLLASNFSVECESNLKFCYMEHGYQWSDYNKVTRRGCTTGAIAAIGDQFVCQTDNCNSHNYNELIPASKNASSGVTASKDMHGTSDPDSHTPSTCQSCHGYSDCRDHNLVLLPPTIQGCDEDHLFCATTFANITWDKKDVVWKGCAGYDYKLFNPDTYFCRTDNCNDWKTFKEADYASLACKGGVINGARAEKSFMRK